MSIRKRTWSTNGVEKTAWQVDYVDASGKRRRKNFGKKKDADAFLANAKVEVRDGIHVPDSETITVKEAAKLWLKACAAAGLEQSTIDQYEQHVRLHIVPLIGATKLNRLAVPSIRAFQDELRDAGRSPAMVKRVSTSLGAILSDAQGRGLVIRNAVHEMSRSRSRREAKVEKRQKKRIEYGIDIPTLEEIRAIVNACEGRYRPLLLTAIFTGLRSSELRGLPWRAIDLKKATLTVLQRADKAQVIGLPKSDASHRTLPLPPLVLNALREWKLACPKGELVFPNSEGNVEWHANIINRGLQPTMIRAGVTANIRSEVTGNVASMEPQAAPKYTGLHALRHWYASWLINRPEDGGLGLAPKAVQQRMGHSSIQITFDTYGHLFPAADESAAMEAAQNMLLGT